jgi:hypothetical protein
LCSSPALDAQAKPVNGTVSRWIKVDWPPVSPDELEMSLEAGSKILGGFEAIIYMIALAGWAALGFPYFGYVIACGCAAIISFAIYKWMASRLWF